MAFNLPPPPTSNDPRDPAFRDWFYKLQKAFSTLGSFLFTNLDFTGSNITSIVTRNHADLQNLNTASYTHLTSTQATDLTDGGDSTLHFHSSDRDLANATGTLAIANGGTGQITATAAFDALAPTTTAGDIIYHNGTDNVRLPIGSSGQGLLVSSGIPSWGNITAQVKVYEPTIVSGFFDNVGYLASEPLLPEFVTDSNGDIVMAWGGDYAV